MTDNELRAIVEDTVKVLPFDDITHCDRVLSMVGFLAGREGVSLDQRILSLAALLHDLGASKSIAGHESISCEMATPLLNQLDGLDEQSKNRILYIIDNHVASKSPSTVEAKLFRDADMLDLLGVVGLCRQAVNSHCSGKGFTLVETIVPKVLSTVTEEKFSTSSAREIARKRLARMKDALDVLNGEIHDINK